MSNQSKFDQLQSEDFKPLSESEESYITGGALKPGRCKDDEYLDPVTAVCVKKSNHPTSPTS